MPIEGPIQELGLPDVFQLIDLSRKTGMLHVTAAEIADEGVVFFDRGRVVQALLRSRPVEPLDGAMLTPRELQRRLRVQIELAVFEMMNWREGYFSFEERSIAEVPAPDRANIATESLLMESARRIDEWSRMAGRISGVDVVPILADLPGEHETALDLLPHEWEVLSLIDGERDIRAIAQQLGRSEFDTAKVVFGLITTGVVEVLRTEPEATDDAALAVALQRAADVEDALERGFAGIRAGSFPVARESLERFLSLDPGHVEADRARAALRALASLTGTLDGGLHV
ncbi:MAG TPA: DUF4388 domain-containing protein [Gemmatimonadaceae bacterium]|nr:DUF4388 domain-containing protein [Gemmatimonadaceae bacterium]